MMNRNKPPGWCRRIPDQNQVKGWLVILLAILCGTGITLLGLALLAGLATGLFWLSTQVGPQTWKVLRTLGNFAPLILIVMAIITFFSFCCWNWLSYHLDSWIRR